MHRYAYMRLHNLKREKELKNKTTQAETREESDEVVRGLGGGKGA